jgi:hypothetical protein
MTFIRRLAPPLAALALLLVAGLPSAAVADACTPTALPGGGGIERPAQMDGMLDVGCSSTILHVNPNPAGPGDVVTFDGADSIGPNGTLAEIKRFDWDFGDTLSAETVTGVDPSAETTTHTYSARGHYVATLTTRDTLNQLIGTSTPIDVFVSATPVAALAAVGPVLRPEVPYDFDASGSSEPDAADGGFIHHYVWQWGDGSPAQQTSGPTTQHTFAEGASTSVSVTAVNDVDLASVPATRAITVHNELPLIQLIATPSTVNVGQQLTLSAAGSSDPDGIVKRYDWDLDANGSFETPTLLTPTVTAGPYPNGGVLHPRVRVTDDSGGTSIASVPVTVVDPTGGTGGGSGAGGGGGGSGGSKGSGGGASSGGSGSGGGSGGGSSSGGTADPFAVGLSGSSIQRLKTALLRGVGLQARANRAATGTLTLSVGAGDARRLGLSRKARKPVEIGTLKLALRAGRTAKPSIKLTRKATVALRRLSPRTVRVTIRGTLAAGNARVSAVRVVLLRG